MPVKPSESEQEYFTRLEIERKKKHVDEQAKKLAEQQRAQLKDLHWMHCPKCGLELEAIHYKDLEIDRCFNCNGTWLDAGELEKIAGGESKTGPLSVLLKVFKQV